MRWFLCVAVLACLTPLAVQSQQPPDRVLLERCLNMEQQFDSDTVVDACTSFLESVQLTEDEQFAIIYRYRAKALLELEEYDRAISDLNQSIRFDDSNDYSYWLRATAHMSKEDWDRAIADYTIAIGLRPDDAGSFGLRGRAYHEKQEFERAIADYNVAIRLDPDDSSNLFSRGLALWDAGHLERALADYNAYIRVEPGDITAYINRGHIQADLGRMDGAVADFDHVFAMADTDWGRAWAAGTAAWMIATGPRGDARLGLKYARRAVRLDPREFRAWNGLGASLTVDGQTVEALAAYERAMTLGVEHVEDFQRFLKKRGLYTGAIDGKYGPGTRAALKAQIATGCAVQDEECEPDKRSQPRAAKPAQQRTARLSKPTPSLDEWADDVCANKGDKQDPHDVVMACTQVIDRGDSFLEKGALPYFSRGTAYMDRGECDRAVPDLDTAIDLAFDDDELKANALNSMGWIYVTCQRSPANAMLWAERALELAPDDAHIHDTIAAAHTRARRPEEALNWYESAIRLNPEFIRIYQDFLKRRGRYDGPVDGVYGPGTRAAVQAQIGTRCPLQYEKCR